MATTATSPSFYDARLREQTIVPVGGQPTSIKTFAFFRHVVFEKFRREYFKCALNKRTTPKERCDKFTELLNASGIDWSNVEPDEIPDLFEALVRVNKIPPLLAWQEPTASPAAKSKDVQATLEDNLQYEGRDLASTVALLSSVFGWTADYVLNDLSLYEVNCYVQEALLLQHKEQEMHYNFAEVGFKKVGDSYEKVPYPDPPWVKKSKVVVPDQIKNVVIPQKFRPDGLIVDFTHMESGKATTYTIGKDGEKEPVEK